MAMKLFKRDANALFILLATVALLGFIGVAIYFQLHMAAMNQSYNDATAQVKQLKEELDYQINSNNNLNDTLAALEDRYNQQKVQIENAFNILQGEKTNLTVQLNSTQQTLTSTQSQLATVQASLAVAQANITTLKDALDVKSGMLSSVNSSNADALDRAMALYDLMQNYIDNNRTSTDDLAYLQNKVKLIEQDLQQTSDLMK